jgi:hypothetical protein
MFGENMFDNCQQLKNVNIHIDTNKFLELTEAPNIGDAVSSLFAGITPLNNCYINFNDAIYMNNGIVKIDDEYIETKDVDGNTILTALNYIDMYNDDKTYLNLSNITSVD